MQSTDSGRLIALDGCRRRGSYGGEKGLYSVCKWAMVEFGLAKMPSSHTVFRIIDSEDVILGEVDGLRFNSKKALSVTNIELDETMAKWIMDTWDRSLFLSDVIMKENTRRVQTVMNASRLELQKYTNLFSNGWLHKFKRRNNLK